MFVRCSNCQTQFSLDDRQVGADGVAVRCAVCRYVFRVEPPDTAAAMWRVQTVDGDVFEAEDLPTLRVWVREGRLHPDDTISRTGKHWIRLGDMPEFSDAFAGFPDLPEVLSAPGGGAIETGDLSTVGPPPSFAGDDQPTAVADAVQPVVRAASERLDMSGLFSMPEEEDSSDDLPIEEDPDDTVVRGRMPSPSPSEDTVTVGPGAVSRTSLFEDSASMVLDDLVVPEPELPTEVVPASGSQSKDGSGPRRKPKHQTTKVRTVAAAAEANADESGVVRVLDEAELAAAAEADAVQPRVPSNAEASGRRSASGASMLGAVTAHVQSEPIRPIRGTTSAPISITEERETPEPVGVALETVEPSRSGRATWPLFAGLGLLCGAAVVFGIPQVREKVLGSSSTSAQPEDPAAVQALKKIDAAIHEGTLDGLQAASASADGGALSPTARADLALAGAEAKAAEAIALRLQAMHAPSSDASFRADDAAEAAAHAFAGVDVERATPKRLARTRARVRLAQGRPEDEVLPLVPADEPELRALVLGAQLWSDPGARVPSGLISTLSGLPQPSVAAQVLLATAYARGGDEVGAAAVRDALKTRAADDPVVAALLTAQGEAAAVADASPEDGDPEIEDSGDGAEPDETIVVKDIPKGMSIDKLISQGCDKVEGGDVADGLKMLLKAFDKRPNDIDVLVCLGAANRKKGVPSTALRYYERALGRSPRFLPALLGAARSATKLGDEDKAVEYYRRVLAVSPGDAEAKSYIAKKSAADKKPAPPSEPDDAERKPEPPSPTPSGDLERKPEPPRPESPAPQ